MNLPGLGGDVEDDIVAIVQGVYGSGQAARTRGGVGGYNSVNCAGDWHKGHHSDEH
jgi:hypothetical protein